MNVLKVTIEMIFSKTQKVVKPTEVHVHLFFNPTGTQKNISNYKSHKEMNKSLSHQGLAILGNFLFLFFFKPSALSSMLLAGVVVVQNSLKLLTL